MDYDKVKQKYQDHFTPDEFSKLVKAQDALYMFFQRHLHDIFNSDLISGSTLVDFGCGPTTSNLFPVTKVCKEVVLCDYLEQNRCAVQKWINKHPDALDWTLFATTEAKLEGYGDIEAGAEEIQERTRDAIKHVVPCDLHDMSVMPEAFRVEYDVLLTSLCLEIAALDMDTYNKGVFNLSQLIKPGGSIVQCGAIGATSYNVGNTKFDALFLTEDNVKCALENAGFVVKYWQSSNLKNASSLDHGAFVVSAKKL